MPDDKQKKRLAAALDYYKSLYIFQDYEITSPTSHGMDEDTPIHMAAYDGRIDFINDMLPFVKDINIRGDIGNTPLHYAVMRSNISAAEFLLTHGADIMRGNDYDDTPLEWMSLNPQFNNLIKKVLNNNHPEQTHPDLPFPLNTDN